jgi:dienelactone hydrolase
MPWPRTLSIPRCCGAVLLVAFATGAPVRAQSNAPAATVQEAMARDLREEIVRIAVTVKDLYGRQETRPMPITIFRPAGDGPFPLVVFNHGRAVADKRAPQGRWRPEHAARYLVAKGFVVLAPTRIGYWETYGDFDPEAGGDCRALQPEPMSIAASEQVLATVAYAKSLPYVDASRWLVAGQSVGGLSSIATVGRNPPGLLGGLNFSGGTGGNPDLNPGRPCSPQSLSTYWGGLARTATVPMLWMYWQNDKYWGADIPVQWHKAWMDGGGRAEFVRLGPVGEDGHAGWSIDMDNWMPLVDAFLAKLGFTRPGIATRPPASGFADLTNAEKVPVSAASRTGPYARFLESRSPRAFAVGGRGAWGSASGDYAHGKALGNCQRSGQNCRLYAIDDMVVWRVEP